MILLQIELLQQSEILKSIKMIEKLMYIRYVIQVVIIVESLRTYLLDELIIGKKITIMWCIEVDPPKTEGFNFILGMRFDIHLKSEMILNQV